MKTIKTTPSYKLVYDSFQGVARFVRLSDNKVSYWATGQYAQDAIKEAEQMSIKELEEKAEQYKYH